MGRRKAIADLRHFSSQMLTNVHFFHKQKQRYPFQVTLYMMNVYRYKCDKVFKNGPSKNCERQLLRNL